MITQPTLAEPAKNVALLHELLRYDPEHPVDALHVTVENINESESMLSVSHQPGHHHLVPVHYWKRLVPQLLCHYPVPVNINDEPVERRTFSTEPYLSIKTQHTAILTDDCQRQEDIEYICSAHPKQGQILVDGVTYRLAEPDNILKMAPRYGINQDWPHVAPKRDFLCKDPKWPATHYSLLQQYRAEFNLSLEHSSEQERLDSVFAYTSSTYYCLPAPSAYHRLAAQEQQAIAAMLEQASKSGHTIVDENDISVHQSWQEGYDKLPISLLDDTLAVRIEQKSHDAATHSIARALYRHSGCAMVAVSQHDPTPYRLVPQQVIYFNESNTRFTVPFEEVFSHFASPTRLPFTNVSNLHLEATLYSGDWYVRDVVIPLPRLILGWLNYPHVVVNRSYQQHLRAMTRDLVQAYYQDPESDYGAAVSTCELVATRCLLGELQGFMQELQNLVDQFEPQSEAPQHPVALASTSGKQTLIWYPGNKAAATTKDVAREHHVEERPIA